MVRAAHAAAAALTISVVVSAQPSLSLDQVMDRFASYLQAYGEEYAATVSDERYIQTAADGQTALLESEFGIVKASGRAEWLGFRDVLRLNEQPIEDRGARLSRLFADASSAEGINRATTSQAMRIVRESARFNIGSIERTINNPALVLALLDPSHHRGFRFSKRGEEDVAGTLAWRIRYDERQSPTIIKTINGRDIRSSGDVWVDPANGRLLRGDVTMRLVGLINRPGWVVQGYVSVTFSEDANLKLFVPDRMTERYEFVSGGGTIQQGDATYTNYRRFRVETKIIGMTAP